MPSFWKRRSSALRLFFGFAACAISATFADEPPGYYAAAVGFTGTALRSALHTIIKTGHIAVGYGNSDEAMLVTDESPNDSTRVTLLYSRRQELKVYFIGNGNPTPPGSLGWNREHQWPDSLGIDGREPMYSDLFNLRPADVDVNGDRGNLYYDESTVGASGYQNPAHPEATLCTQDGDSWEPPAEVKGDIARSMFYMDLRYEGTGGEPDLRLTDNAALINSSSAYMGRLSTLLVWHFLDPVSDAERLRNDRVYSFQHNRNPFIDHPEWVEALYGPVFQIQIGFTGGSQTVVRWPAQIQSNMYEIRSSPDLLNWQPMTLAPVTNGQWREATVPITSDRKFFVLRLLAPQG